MAVDQNIGILKFPEGIPRHLTEDIFNSWVDKTVEVFEISPQNPCSEIFQVSTRSLASIQRSMASGREYRVEIKGLPSFFSIAFYGHKHGWAIKGVLFHLEDPTRNKNLPYSYRFNSDGTLNTATFRQSLKNPSSVVIKEGEIQTKDSSFGKSFWENYPKLSLEDRRYVLREWLPVLAF